MTARTIPRRYQLTKGAVGAVVGGHPWVFRSHMSSAAQVFADGQWLVLHDGHNRVVGHGIYQAAGAIAIRVIARGAERPRWKQLAPRVDAALAARAELRTHTDAYRVIHGESDRLPAVVVEVLAGTVVVTSYATGVDGLARAVARKVAADVGATGILARVGHRRAGDAAGPTAVVPPRVLRGNVPDVIELHEDGVPYAIDPRGGQKGGAFLDLRGLRRDIAGRALTGARVLNVFAYTGMLGRAAERAGAAHVVHVDASAAALAFGTRHHVDDPTRHTRIVADAFAWLHAPPAGEAYDLVIVDPPSMTSRADQVGKVLGTYRGMFARAAALVAPGGALVTACCTSRVSRADFLATAKKAVGDAFSLEVDLPPEPDHPAGFPEADYLKILGWRRLLSPA